MLDDLEESLGEEILYHIAPIEKFFKIHNGREQCNYKK